MTVKTNRTPAELVLKTPVLGMSLKPYEYTALMVDNYTHEILDDLMDQLKEKHLKQLPEEVRTEIFYRRNGVTKKALTHVAVVMLKEFIETGAVSWKPSP